MLINKVIGKVGTKEDVSDKKTEWIELDWEELSKRILRTETDQGTDIALSLDQEEPLQYGDLLFEDDNRRIAVRTKMEPVIGIDLGTTYSAVATVEGGKPILIASRHGARLTPSIIPLTARGYPTAGERARTRWGHGISRCPRPPVQGTSWKYPASTSRPRTA